MKHMRFVIIMTMALMPFVLASCWNDEDHEINCGKDIAYIKTVNQTVCAATSCGYVTSREISSLTPHECYLLGYRISQPAVNGIYTADIVSNLSKEPLKQLPLEIGTPPSDQGIPVNALAIPYFSATDYLGDRWMFTYWASLKENDQLTAHFYYDKTNQVDSSGQNVKGKGEFIIDVYFTKSTSAGDASVAKERCQSSIGNLESLRSFFYLPEYCPGALQNQGGGLYDLGLLQFRYHKYVSPGQSRVCYLGTWDRESLHRQYYIIEYLYTK